ncbi:MFS transporter [Pseudonocardia sp. HH130630-07]|uniref:MFS transporter n=1 Tax=Pseudonocardia sp. HH130630-07 TaxID=1690815 RepID=UPI000814DF63|nr:MFS transporter [Pseudonocardia sp. HH130630-07]ANY10850.1 multidrug transporter [Pseudonocardia sp. HH130630-07]
MRDGTSREPGSKTWSTQRTPAAAWLITAVACAAEFMVVLDASVVNVALPAIQEELRFSPAGLQWVVTSYALVFAGFLLLGGRLADLYGLRRMLLAGLAIFVVASVVGGLAVTADTLIAARAAQALGAAVLAPTSLTILTTTFPEGPRRVRALATWTALASAAGAAGSLLGGILTEFLTWRATLLVNLPIGAIAFIAAARTLPAGNASVDGQRLDVPGAVAATVSMTALTFAVSGAETRGWASPVTLAALSVAALALTLFVAHEGWWSSSPLIPLRLFALRSISAGNVAIVLAGACLMPMWYFLSLYMQQGLGLSAGMAGLGFLPHTVITVLVGAQIAPRVMRRVPERTVLFAGALLAAAGFWWQSRVGVTDTYWTGVLGPAIVMSTGTGLINTPLSTLVTSGVTDRDAGAASGLMNTTKQVGGAVGLATIATIATASAYSASGPVINGSVLSTATAFECMTALMVGVAALAALLPAARTATRRKSNN